MKPRTAVAISGGVDSLTAALLLKQNGHDVMGVHFITGFETRFMNQQDRKTRHPHHHPVVDKMKIMEDQLGIPISVLDCRKEFQEHVVQYFITSYLEGRTPNPCLVCNSRIKFDILLQYAKSLGAERLATGHYVQKHMDHDGTAHLLKGDDPRKDQSYFLAFLSQEQLMDACFPLGSMHKANVIKIAEENGLKPVTHKESQDICFIHGNSYVDFFQDRNILFRPGMIIDKHGKTIGKHNGLHHFTIGQRRGINCPAPNPYYVLQLDTTNNRLIVGEIEDLFSSVCKAENINWIIKPSSFPITCSVKIRYHHKPAPATITEDDLNAATISFQTPQLSVTPGQGAVFYIGNEVIGGGWISRDA
ncbi:MAG: tRNA 2-thiouridine(34) synthase MnmA [Desulfobacteraceae bacterium]|nr:MAG: tRNA 2-thiouridine(34) synthase MnmA [Desulfobacteraceae bacterium]